MRDKINLSYVKKLNQHIERLEYNKEKLQNEKFNAQSLLEEKLKTYERLIFKKEEMEVEYEELLNFIINKGILLQTNNSIYKLNQWDSLTVVEEKNKGLLIDKKSQVIKVIDESYMKVLKGISNKGYTVSYLVIRASASTALIQGRFAKK